MLRCRWKKQPRYLPIGPCRRLRFPVMPRAAEVTFLVRRQVIPTRSYLSQVELPVTIGLGSSTTADHVKICWPDGLVQEIEKVELDTLTVLEQNQSSSISTESVSDG